ncbi:MAG: benzoate/H(+) symporter BenE family transporter [Alphaproteobacteria bacterium]
MLKILERPKQPLPRPGEAWAALDRHAIANGITAMLMACTGPLVIMLSVGVGAGMSQADIVTWMFGGYAIGGVFSIVFSILYRMPMGMAWTIPGVILLASALDHLSFPEVVGALYVTAGLLFVLGLSGWVRRIMDFIPLSIVMAMVAGVFLPFVLKIVTAFEKDWLIAGVTLGTFVVISLAPALARIDPPVLAALVAGALAAVLSDQVVLKEPLQLAIAEPILYRPVFSWRAIVELVVPMAVTVVGIHNAQGFAISRDNGYDPPVNTLTTACGVGSVMFALFGTVSTCVTGPANAILNSSGEKKKRFMGGVVFGVLILLFGLFAPVAAQMALAMPSAFIGLLGGLAIFHVLRGAFVTAFGGRFQMGALVAFIVTVAGLPIVNIGAPFWGIVLGTLTSLLLERGDFHAGAESPGAAGN